MGKTAFILYLFALVFSILMFGAVHTWVYSLVFLCVFVASLLIIICNIKQNIDGKYVFRCIKTGMTPLFVFFVIFIIFQMTPLPDYLISLLSPEAKVAGLASIPASRMVAPLPEGAWFTLAPYVYPVRMSLISWTVYGLLFMGLVQTLNTRKRIEVVILCILVVATLDSLYGIMQTYSRYEHIWWLKKFDYFGVVTGTYINRNHFAGLMEMSIAITVVYAAVFSSLHIQKKRTLRRGITFKDRILAYSSAGSLLQQRVLIIFMGVVMALGLILSASRGGIIATGVALLFLGLMLVFRKNQRRKGYVILVLFLVTTAYALSAGIDYTVGRFKQFESGREDRMVVTKVVLQIFEDYKKTGTGIGNFQYSYPKYQPERYKKQYFLEGHNDWAQFLSEAGWVGMILLVVGMGWFLFWYVRQWLRRDDSFAVCLGAGALAALVAIAVHSWSDFNLHVPANFMMLAAVLAIGTRSIYSEEHMRGGEGERRSQRADGEHRPRQGDEEESVERSKFSRRKKKDIPLAAVSAVMRSFFDLFRKRRRPGSAGGSSAGGREREGDGERWSRRADGDNRPRQGETDSRSQPADVEYRSQRVDEMQKVDSPNFSLREKKDSPLSVLSAVMRPFFNLFRKHGIGGPGDAGTVRGEERGPGDAGGSGKYASGKGARDGAREGRGGMPVYELPLWRGGIVPLALLTVLILWSGQWLIRHFVAEAHCNTVPNSTLNIDNHPPEASIERAIKFDGGNGEYHFKLAKERTVRRDKEARQNGANTPAWQASHGPIIRAFEDSIRLNPFNAEAHKCLGWEYTYLASEPDYGKKWLPAAELSVERAIYMGGDWVQNPLIQVDYGNFWVMRSKAYGFDLPRQEALWTRALSHYRKAVELTGNKNIIKDVSNYVRNFYPDEEKLKQIGN